jgi:hypothetical protein
MREVPTTEICTPAIGWASTPMTCPLTVPVACARAMLGSNATRKPSVAHLRSLMIEFFWFENLTATMRDTADAPRVDSATGLVTNCTEPDKAGASADALSNQRAPSCNRRMVKCWTWCARKAAHCPMHRVTAATNHKLPNGGLGKRLTGPTYNSLKDRILRVQVVKLRNDENCHIRFWPSVRMCLLAKAVTATAISKP